MNTHIPCSHHKCSILCALASLTGKRAFLKQHFCMKFFSDSKILVTFLIQNLEMFVALQSFMDTSTGRGVYQNLGKISESSFFGNGFFTGKMPTFMQQKKFLEEQIFK